MNTPKTTPSAPDHALQPKELFLFERVELESNPTDSLFYDVLHAPDPEPDPMPHTDLPPNGVQFSHSVLSPNETPNLQTAEIAQEIVKQIEIAQSEQRPEVRISVEVQGAILWIRVKQRRRGVDITLRTKDVELKRQLNGTKDELVRDVEASVALQKLKIV